MQTLTGVGVCAGRVIGELVSMPEPVSEPAAGLSLGGEQPDAAVARLHEAAAAVKAELKRRAEAATEKDAADVLKSTALMAGDKALLKNAAKLITGGGLAPERALWEAASDYAEQMRSLGGYMAERAADIEDVRARLVCQLQGLPMPGVPHRETPFVLTAEDLAPADTATLDPEKVLALVTSGGGPQSHTAILARNLGLPAVVAARGVEALADGTAVFVDGASGEIRTEPGPEEQELVAAWLRSAEARSSFDGHGVLADGTEVPLLANVGTPEDARAAAAAGAQGVGLLRTEFCFLGRDKEPSVEEQVEQYTAILASFPGQKVVVRTLDAGADKPLPFLTDTEEPNPALGVRGYRTDRTVPGVLGRQLEAIALAEEATEAQVWVMAPMISTTAEAQEFAAMASAAGLRVPGVMVETPAAAVTADQILRHVRFVSLGTNDLTQYTMAADRMLGSLAELNNPWQPAVLRMVRYTVEGARRAEAEGAGERNVGVCGEAAADPALAVVLVGLGVHTLSMSARGLSAVAAVLRSVDLATAQGLAELAVQQGSAEEASAAVRAELPVLTELGL
ncbi:phosphoenolpyruvate--protein phosphotransferase [Kocuria sp. M1R5S2]|uniref:phosphoenolpyruvate--protein phosphotransferase n=1 Tax=Kocuria rhizosphaerae TaxID=3376285 RepID=UPI00379A15AB